MGEKLPEHSYKIICPFLAIRFAVNNFVEKTADNARRICCGSKCIFRIVTQISLQLTRTLE
jgi:hypothetical protein